MLELNLNNIFQNSKISKFFIDDINYFPMNET